MFAPASRVFTRAYSVKMCRSANEKHTALELSGSAQERNGLRRRRGPAECVRAFCSRLAPMRARCVCPRITLRAYKSCICTQTLRMRSRALHSAFSDQSRAHFSRAHSHHMCGGVVVNLINIWRVRECGVLVCFVVRAAVRCVRVQVCSCVEKCNASVCVARGKCGNEDFPVLKRTRAIRATCVHFINRAQLHNTPVASELRPKKIENLCARTHARKLRNIFYVGNARQRESDAHMSYGNRHG